jgi:hypothetical protein
LNQTLAEDVVGKSHRINSVTGSHWRRGIHDLTKLHPGENLIPHVESRSGRDVSGSISIGENAGSGAELQLHHNIAAVRPLWPL